MTRFYCFDTAGKLAHTGEWIGGNRYVLTEPPTSYVATSLGALYSVSTLRTFALYRFSQRGTRVLYVEESAKRIKTTEWTEFEECSHGLHPVHRYEHETLSEETFEQRRPRT